MDLRADENIRKAAKQKQNLKIITMVTRELVAAEAQYHRFCYRSTTARKPKVRKQNKIQIMSDNVSLEAHAYDMLFDYVRNDLLENPRVVKLSDLCAQLLFL